MSLFYLRSSVPKAIVVHLYQTVLIVLLHFEASVIHSFQLFNYLDYLYMFSHVIQCSVIICRHYLRSCWFPTLVSGLRCADQ